MSRLFNTLLLLLFCAIGLTPVNAQQRQLAFPGADGYGRFVTGGRGGEVCYVTRLDDCTDQNLVEGTLRWAIRHDNGGRPRTILFATSGTIYLTSKLKLQYPDVSILGQTAPGGGITITGYNMYICKNNVIVRYLRFRAGDIPNTSMTGLDIENADRVILDHCSMTWSMEECLTAYDTDSTTIQWCIIGEGLYNSKNSKGARAYATQWGGEHSTMHHTLITNSHSRAPRFNGVRSPSGVKGEHDYQVDSEFANNVVFNWSGSGNQYGGEYDKSKVEVNFWTKNDPGYNRVYLINNFYRPGPATKKNCTSKRYWCAPSSPYGQWYLKGNKFEVGGTYSTNSGVWSTTELNKVNADNYYGAQSGTSSRGIDLTGSNFTSHVMTEMPYALSGLQYESADEAYQHVVTQAGASLPRYDEVDKRLLDEAAGTIAPTYHGPSINEPGIIDSPSDVQLSYPDSYIVDGITHHDMPCMFFEGKDLYFYDSDADGMPDGYEDEYGFDKNDAADGSALAANGYTNLENYLNAVADGKIAPNAYCTSATFVEPGPQEDAPATVTYTFSKGTATCDGNVPAAITAPFGEQIIIPANHTLYREGCTLSHWNTGMTLVSPGEAYSYRRDITLTPTFSPNKVSLKDRTQDVTITWDFTASDAPSLDGSGIYVTQANFSGAAYDVKLTYKAGQLTLPSCPGAPYTLQGTTTISGTAEGDVLTVEAPESLTSVTITLPYLWNTADRIYHTPDISIGQEFELYYTTRETVEQSDWISASFLDYAQYRTFYDPKNDDEQTITDGSAAHPYLYCVVFNGSDRTYNMFIKEATRVKVFLCHQSSNADQCYLVAYPSDGSEPLSVRTATISVKQQPVNLELELDPTKQYRLQLYSRKDYDWAIAAVKLWGENTVATEGNASITWTWDGSLNADGTVNPDRLFVSAKAGLGSKLEATGESKAWNKTFLGIQPSESVTEPDRQCAITFIYRPATGFFFQPEHLRFSAVKQGTDMGRWTITLQQGGGQEQTIVSELNPARNNEETYTQADFDLSSLTESSSLMTIVRFYLLNANTAKVYGLADIEISGTYSGQMPEVKRYNFSAVASPAEAATVSWTPAGDVFDAGTQLTVEATANAGYYFQGWVNESNDIVSTQPQFTFKLDGDTQLTALYKSRADFDVIFTDCAPYDAVVSDVTELTIALDAAATRANKDERYRIFLRNGLYDFGTKAKTAIPAMTSLIGQSQDGVLILNNPGSVSNYQEQTPVFFIDQNQNDVYMQDLTIRQARDWASKKSQGQALALRQRGKRAVYKNVCLQGVQDTYYLNKADGTAYFETSTISGDVDFIYGDGTMWFEQCLLNPLTSGAVITASNAQAGYKGIIFNGCTIDGASGYRLGRPWNDSPAVTYLHTTMRTLPNAAGWGSMTSGLKVRFHEYGSMDANGNLLNLSSRSIAACAATAASDAPVLTAEQAEAYTLASTFKDWNPQERTQQMEAPEIYYNVGISWMPIDGAIGYVVFVNDQAVAFTPVAQAEENTDWDGIITVRAVNEMGGLGKPSNELQHLLSIQSVQAEGFTIHSIHNLQGQPLREVNAPGIYVINGRKMNLR